MSCSPLFVVHLSLGFGHAVILREMKTKDCGEKNWEMTKID